MKLHKVVRIVTTLIAFLISIPLINLGVVVFGINMNISSNKDIQNMTYILQIMQFGIGTILSFLVYNSSRRDVEKEEKRIKRDILLGIKYVRNEINYNMCLLKTIEQKSLDFKTLESAILKSDAWDKYSINILDKLGIKTYNKFLTYYTAVSLCKVSEFQNDAIKKVKDADELLKILDSLIEDMK